VARGTFANRDFVRLWCAATASNFGSMVGTIALPFTAILVLGATPANLALLGACRLLPGFVLGLVASARLERWRKRRVLVACDWARAAILVTVPAAVGLGALRMEHLYAVALGSGLCNFLFDVAHVSYLPTLVDRRELLEANSRLKAAEAVTEGGAFAVGGWLVQLLTAPLALLVDAASFVASALWLRTIRREEILPEPASRDVAAEIAEGIRVLWRSPLLLPLAAGGVLAAFSFQVVGVVYLLYVSRELGFAPGLLGLIFAVGAGSSFVGALAAERATARFGLGRVLWSGLALAGLATLLLPLAPAASLVGALCLVAHQLGDGAAVVHQVSDVSLRQSVTPGRVLARVNGTFHFAALGSMLLGTLVGGALGEALGLRAALVTGAAGTLAGALVIALSPLGELRAPPGPHEAPAESTRER
jgi:Na+/melibiose symporter-like transporter